MEEQIIKIIVETNTDALVRAEKRLARYGIAVFDILYGDICDCRHVKTDEVYILKGIGNEKKIKRYLRGRVIEFDEDGLVVFA